jgi:hypothetical protein
MSMWLSQIDVFTGLRNISSNPFEQPHLFERLLPQRLALHAVRGALSKDARLAGGRRDTGDEGVQVKRAASCELRTRTRNA